MPNFDDDGRRAGYARPRINLRISGNFFQKFTVSRFRARPFRKFFARLWTTERARCEGVRVAFVVVACAHVRVHGIRPWFVNN